jgi:uncharacterized GH25 family protein
MGSRLALPALLIAALVASALFWWLSNPSEGERGTPTLPVAEAPAPAAAETGELAAPDGPSGADEPLERIAVSAPATAGPVAPETHAHRAEDAPRIEGRVLDRGGQPVAGAVVRAEGPGRLFDIDTEAMAVGGAPSEATTDSEGRFALQGPAPGEVTMRVRAAGFAPLDRRDVPVPADDVVVLEPFVLSRGAILSGHVLDSLGRGVPGAELVSVGDRDAGGMVIIGGKRETVATTAEDGTFRIDQLACGAWKIQVHHDDHPDELFQGLAEVPGEEVAGLAFVLRPGTTISGRVKDVPPGELADLVVRASEVGQDWLSGVRSRKAEVVSDGSFELRGLASDKEYELQARTERDEERTLGFFGRSRSESVRAWGGDVGVVIPYQPEGVLVFQVLDATTRQPLTDFTVEAGVQWPAALRDEDGRVLRTHPEGRVRVGALRPETPEDRVTVTVNAPGYEPYSRDSIAIVAGQELDLGPILLEPVPVVSVTVLDRATGEPVQGATVTIEKEVPAGATSVNRRIEVEDTGDGVSVTTADAIGKTDADGLAVLNSLGGETVTLRVESEAHAPFVRNGLALPRGSDVIELVELSLGGEVVVTVLDPEGEPIAGARVRHREAGQPMMMGFGTGFLGGGGGGTPVTDSSGTVRFTRLRAGLHEFQLNEEQSSGGVFLEGGATINIGGTPTSSEGWTEVEVFEGGVAAVTLEASPRGSLTGRVREAGKLLAGATLSLKEKRSEPVRPNPMTMFGGGGGRRERTDGDGEYAFTDVKEGAYVLEVTHPTRRMPVELDVTVLPEENTFDVDLSVAIVEGRITSVDGEPLEGITVSAERVREEEAGGGRQMFAIRMISDDGGNTVLSSDGELGGDSTVTDADGRYTLRGVTPDVKLAIVAEGPAVQEKKSDPLTVAGDETLRGVDLVLEEAGRVSVEVLTASGSPAGFSLVRATFVDDESVAPQVEFAEDGTANLVGLRPGNWRLNASSVRDGGGGPGVDRDVQVVGGEEAHVTIHLE